MYSTMFLAVMTQTNDDILGFDIDTHIIIICNLLFNVDRLVPDKYFHNASVHSLSLELKYTPVPSREIVLLWK